MEEVRWQSPKGGRKAEGKAMPRAAQQGSWLRQEHISLDMDVAPAPWATFLQEPLTWTSGGAQGSAWHRGDV